MMRDTHSTSIPSIVLLMMVEYACILGTRIYRLHTLTLAIIIIIMAATTTTTTTLAAPAPTSKVSSMTMLVHGSAIGNGNAHAHIRRVGSPPPASAPAVTGKFASSSPHSLDGRPRSAHQLLNSATAYYAADDDNNGDEETDDNAADIMEQDSTEYATSGDDSMGVGAGSSISSGSPLTSNSLLGSTDNLLELGTLRMVDGDEATPEHLERLYTKLCNHIISNIKNNPYLRDGNRLEWHSEDDIDYYSDDSGKVLPRMIVRQYLTAPEQLFIRLIEPSVPEEDYYYALSTNNNNENNQQQQQQQQQPSKSGSLEVEKLICSCPRLCEPLTTDAASATNQVYPEQVTPWPRDLLALHESMISTPAANLHQTNSRKRHRRHRSRSNYYDHSKTYDITEVPLPMPLSGRASLRDLPIIPEQTEVRYDYDIVLQLRPDMIPKDGMGGGEESLRVTFRRPRQFLPSLSSARWHNHVSYDYGSKRDLYYDPEYEFDAEYNSEDVNANHHIDDNKNVEEVVTVDLRRFANPFDLDWMGLVEKTLDDWKKQGQINQENARRLLLELEDAASDSSASSTNPFRPRSLVDRLSTASKDYTNWGFGSSNSRSSSSNSNN